MEEIRFKYSLGIIGALVMLIVLPVFGTGGVVLAYVALNNDIDLNINGIEFSATIASIFHGCIFGGLAVAMLALATLAALSLLKSITSKREVVITAESIVAPYSLYSSREVKINLAEITKLSVVNNTLKVTSHKTKLQIPSMALGRSKNFKALVETLSMRVAYWRNNG